MGLTDEQLEARRAYLGGTDAAALAGVNPPSWAQPIDVYEEKLGLAPARAKSGAMGMGDLMEPVVAALFTEATGILLRKPSKPVRSARYPWAGGHLDRWAGGGIFEAKWAMRTDEWGPGLGAGTTEAPGVIPGPYDDTYRPGVPARYAVQVQHYLAVTGRQYGYLAALLGYGDFRWYVLWRDEPLIASLMELEERFWRDNVLARVPPEPDGSEGYGRYLRRRYPASDEDEVVATPEQQRLLDEIRLARGVAADATHTKAKLEQVLQASMGEHGRLVGPGVTVTWRQTKPRLVVDWEALATEQLRLEYETQEQPWPATKKAQAELVRDFALEMEMAHREPGARPFRVTYDSDEAE